MPRGAAAAGRPFALCLHGGGQPTAVQGGAPGIGAVLFQQRGGAAALILSDIFPRL